MCGDVPRKVHKGVKCTGGTCVTPVSLLLHAFWRSPPAPVSLFSLCALGDKKACTPFLTLPLHDTQSKLVDIHLTVSFGSDFRIVSYFGR